MKKIYGFLGAAALLMLASCSTEDVGEAQTTPEAKGGDMFMSMTIAPKGSTGTRVEPGTGTTTGGQGKEVGKDSENKISDGLLIFTKLNGQTYQVFTSKAITGAEIEGVSPYVATFELDRDTFVADVTSSTTYYLFFIANANESGITVSPNTDVQQVLSKSIGDITKTNNFLMTNAELCKVVLAPADVAVGTHTTKAEALQLGTVKVQRAMSRIDIDIDDVTFTQEDDEAFLKDITVKFDGVALVNEATSMNLFKVVADNDTNLPSMTLAENTSGLTWGAPAETTTNYVFSPVQTRWTNPLFGTGAVDSGNADKWKQGNMTETQKNLSTFSYDSFDGRSEDNPFYYPESNSSEYDNEDYHIWRYCMENTNYDKDNQVNGNSTGVIFRAEITGSKISGKTGALYAYNSIIIGEGEDLYDYVNGTDPEDGLWSTIKSKYADAIAAAGEDWDAEAAQAKTQNWSVLDDHLVKVNQFTIYRPDSQGKYYCYYMYWNRHNNNNNNTVMAPMEFATVRNNVYKLKVNSIARLGHPAKPEDDPDPNDPDDPNEKDQFYAQIECVVLDWEVRMNGIDF